MSDLRYTISDTRRGLIIQALDENGAPINVTGWTANLRGTSPDISTPIDIDGSIATALLGTFLFDAPGSEITVLQAGGRDSVQYQCQVRWVDNNGKVGYSAKFPITLDKPI